MKKIFYGWWVVLATSLIHFWGSGTFFYGFTAFFNPLVDEFGWSYAATSFAASLRSVEGGIASPLVGFAADRLGARRLMLLGAILTGVGYLLFSRIDSLWSFYLVFFFLSIGTSLSHPVPGWTSVARWFNKGRGTALGVLSASVGFGGILVYAVNALINAYGWRTSLVIIGIGTWVIGIPLSLMVKRPPETRRPLSDDGKPRDPAALPDQTESESAADSAGEFSLSEAVKTKAFWAIALAATVQAGSLHAVTVHIMPYFLSLDFSRDQASLVAAGLIFVSVTGRFGMGWLSNWIDNRYLLTIGILLQILGLIFLAFTKDMLMAGLFILTYGPGFGGAVTVRLTIQAQYFGHKAYGSIQGAFMGLLIVGTISAPLLTGLCYDLYGDYRPAWLVLMAASIAIIPLVLKIRPPWPL